MRDHAAALDRAHALPRGAELPCHGDGGLGRDGRHVVVHQGLEEEVVAPVLVHEGRVRLPRGQHVVHRRQRLEVHLHRRGQVLGLGAARRHAHGDHLAHMAHLALGQRRLLGGLEAGQGGHRPDRLDAVEVLCGEDAVADGFGDRDGADAAMGDGAAHEGHVLQAGKPDVGHELAAAAHVAVVLLADQPRSDTRRAHRALLALANTDNRP